MKKFFFIATAALGMMAGCQKQDIGDVDKTPVDDASQVAVQFSIDAPSLTLTKGAGPVDAWDEQSLFILGYERTAETFDLNAATTLIPNIETAAPASETVGAINVVHPSTETAIAGEPYYYGDGKVYDFYGYYHDGAATGNLTAGAEGASIALTIDGTQDIMVAKADPGLDVKPGVAERNAYSAYAARRDVHPTLTFEHMLARFNFYVVAGAESGKNVRVTNITLNSYAAATLNVAPTPGLETTGTEKVPFTLAGIGTEEVDETEYPGQTPADNAEDVATIIANPDAKIGNSIMVIPGETSHEIVLTTVNKVGNQTINPLVIPLNAEDIVTEDGKKVTEFQAGYQYDIILTVYGPEEVKITAVLTEWKDGGNTVVDPDKWFEEDNEPSAAVSAVSANSTTFTVNVPEDAVAVQAGYSAAENVEPTTWVDATQTRALNSWTVEMTDLTANTDYYLHVRYANEEITESTTEFETLAPVAFKACAPIQNLTLGLVYDEDTYNTYLTEKYLLDHPYNFEKDNITNFPWLAFKYDEVGTADTYKITFQYKAVDSNEYVALTLIDALAVLNGVWEVDEYGAIVVNKGALKGLTLTGDCFNQFVGTVDEKHPEGNFPAGTYVMSVAYGDATYSAETVVE